MCGDGEQDPAFAAGTSEVAVGFGLLVSCCLQFAPHAHIHSYF